MRLNSLQLVNFRNYNNLYLEFNEKVNLLLGKNGQGKTNIVESIYMLSFGKSFSRIPLCLPSNFVFVLQIKLI